MDEFFAGTGAWRAEHSGAVVGMLVMRGVENPAEHAGLDEVKAEVEAGLRERFGGMEREQLRQVAPLPAYAAYYKRFGQRYHVAMQLESVAQKGKSIPRVAALVEAMFAAELETQILTAGHDLDEVAPPVRIDTGVGAEVERYLAPNGKEIGVKAGDMYIADTRGVLSSIVAGPSAYARIGPGTANALFVAYGPVGVSVEELEAHLRLIEGNVRVVSPGAETVVRRVVVAR